jgi:DNA-binding GntR family transcriptional regulator
VVEAILDGIRAGRYVPGQKLIEADLTHDLEVSRGPVREALKRLSAEGVITLTRHRGAYIRALTRAEADQTLVVLEVLCGLMARLAAEAVKSQRNNAERLRETTGWLGAYRHGESVPDDITKRRHFYDTLAAVGGNRQLNRMMPIMQIHVLRLQIQPFLDASARRSQMRGYAETTRAVLAGDSARAESAMRKHIRRTRARCADLPEEAFVIAELIEKGNNHVRG